MTRTVDVINERINIAGGILTKISELTRNPRPSNNSGIISIDPTVRYNPILVNQIKDELSNWQFVTKELLIRHFGEDSRFTKRFDDSIVNHKIGRDYKAELTRETEAGISALKSIIESIQITGDPSANEDNKPPMVFISHSYQDKEFVEALVELLEGIGLDETTLFCSSVPGYWIGLGKNIIKEIRDLFNKRSLFVIFVQSPNFYKSAVSLNEMGAAWALKSEYCSILTPDMEYRAMTAVVNSQEVAIKVNTSEAKARLTEMKDSILSFLGKPDISPILWERKQDKFLSTVDPSYKGNSSPSKSSTEEYQRLMIEKMKQEKEDLMKASIKGNVFPSSSKGSLHLRIFNAGKSTARNIRIEWLNEDDTVHLSKPLETIEDLSPQNKRDYRLYLVYGHPETMRLRYTWDDDFKTDNTFEEGLQL